MAEDERKSIDKDLDNVAGGCAATELFQVEQGPDADAQGQDPPRGANPMNDPDSSNAAAE